MTGIRDGTQSVPLTAAYGAVNPRYQLLSILYAPPVSATGKSSVVEYADGSSMGSAVSTTKAFSNDISVSASVSAFGVGASAGFDVSESSANTQSVSVTKSLTITKTVTGSDTTDGIDHDWDVYLVWINPQMVALVGQGTGPDLDARKCVWGLQVSPDEGLVFVPLTGGQLKGTAPISAGVKKILDGMGMTTTDCNNILATNPFSSDSNAQPDTTRYVKLSQDFPYVPGKYSTGFTATKGTTVSSGSTHEVNCSVSVGVSADEDFGGLFKATLSVNDKMTFTHSNTINNSNGSEQSASVSIQPPLAGTFPAGNRGLGGHRVQHFHVPFRRKVFCNGHEITGPASRRPPCPLSKGGASCSRFPDEFPVDLEPFPIG